MSVFDRSLQCKEELEQNSRVYWVWDDCFCTDTQPAAIGLRVIFVTSCKQVRRCVAPFASWPSTLHLFLLPLQLSLERHRMEIRHVYVVWIPSSYQSGHWPDSFHQSFLVNVSSTQWKCVKSEARSMDHPITVPSCWKSTVLCDVCLVRTPYMLGIRGVQHWKNHAAIFERRWPIRWRLTGPLMVSNAAGPLVAKERTLLSSPV